jgi:demethylmenaquinone methyltransferase/2-methoxy-6-polyprenyl-1,4-benzoquinol methylase
MSEYEYKGQLFRGLSGGAAYDVLTRLTNIDAFYRRVAHETPLKAGMRVLDMGCGTGTFGFAIAHQLGENGAYVGVDLSPDQVAHARHKAAQAGKPFEFHQCSIDEVPFESASFDTVFALVSLHHVPSAVRRGAIREAARVLKPGGLFVIADLNRPQPNLAGLMGWSLYAFNAFDPALNDHWNNVFPSLCREHNLLLDKDLYITPVIRYQLFSLR